MNNIDILRNKLKGIVKKVSDLPPEIRQHVVYAEDNGQKIYLNLNPASIFNGTNGGDGSSFPKNHLINNLHHSCPNYT